MIQLGNFGATTKVAVTSDAETFEGSRPHTTYTVFSDRAIHIERNTDATTNSFPLAEGEYALVAIAEDESLSFILADAETDGFIYITPVTV